MATKGTLNNVDSGRTVAGRHASGNNAPGTKTVTDLMGKRHPEGPLASKSRVQTTQNGLDKGRKANDAGKQRTDGGKPNGSLKAKPTPAGGTTSTESPMGKAARKLYPSAR